jgi:hypothetical protein
MIKHSFTKLKAYLSSKKIAKISRNFYQTNLEKKIFSILKVTCQLLKIGDESFAKDDFREEIDEMLEKMGRK